MVYVIMAISVMYRTIVLEKKKNAFCEIQILQIQLLIDRIFLFEFFWSNINQINV